MLLKSAGFVAVSTTSSGRIYGHADEGFRRIPILSRIAEEIVVDDGYTQWRI